MPHQILAGLVQLGQPLQQIRVEHGTLRQLRVNLVEEHHAPVHSLEECLPGDGVLVRGSRLLEPIAFRERRRFTARNSYEYACFNVHERRSDMQRNSKTTGIRLLNEKDAPLETLESHTEQ